MKQKKKERWWESRYVAKIRNSTTGQAFCCVMYNYAEKHWTEYRKYCLEHWQNEILVDSCDIARENQWLEWKIQQRTVTVPCNYIRVCQSGGLRYLLEPIKDSFDKWTCKCNDWILSGGAWHFSVEIILLSGGVRFFSGARSILYYKKQFFSRYVWFFRINLIKKVKHMFIGRLPTETVLVEVILASLYLNPYR